MSYESPTLEVIGDITDLTLVDGSPILDDSDN